MTGRVGLRLFVGLMTIMCAGVASAQPTPAPTPVPLPAFAPPPVHAMDSSLFRPFGVDMIGVNDTHALLKMTQRARNDAYYGVLDLTSGCVGETYSTFARVEKLLSLGYPTGRDVVANTVAQRQALAAQALADPATQAEIRQYLALRSRFGDRKDAESIYTGDFAWSADGSKIMVVAAEAFFRSHDGGQTYHLLDTNMSRGPIVTRDGRYAFYQRCGDAKVHNYSCHNAQQIAIVDLTTPTTPRVIPAGRGTIEGLDPTGQKLVFIRDDEPLKVVVSHLDPASATFSRAFAIPAPPRAPNTFYTIDPSRGGKYGTFHHWIDDKIQKVAVVSMTDGRILSQQQRRFVGTGVDDEGRLSWGTVNLVRTFGTTPAGVVKDAGPGDNIGWAPGGRLLVFDYPKGTNDSGTLGDVKCKLVKVVRVGS